MSQLVGSVCVLCQQRISSVVDGDFCQRCGFPVHFKCVKPDSQPDTTDVCTVCGGQNLRPSLDKKFTKKPFQIPGPVQVYRVYRAMRLLVGGVLTIGVGIVLVLLLVLNANLAKIYFQDIIPAAAAFFVAGVGMCVMAVIFLRKKPRKKSEKEKQGG